MAVPFDTPVIRPVAALIEAISGLLLDHAPPGVRSVYTVVPPTQTFVEPPIALGKKLTLTVVVT
jgi:hypothetical protein